MTSRGTGRCSRRSSSSRPAADAVDDADRRLVTVCVDGGAQRAGTRHHLGAAGLQHVPEFGERRQLGTTVEGPLGRAQDDASPEGFEPGSREPDRRAESLLDRFTQAPSRGMIKVFVVAKFGVVSEIDRRLAHVDRRRQALRPRLQAVKLGLRKHRRFHVCDEFRKCTNVDADRVPAGGESLYKRRAATDMVVEHQVAGLGERLDGGASEDRREPGRDIYRSRG